MVDGKIVDFGVVYCKVLVVVGLFYVILYGFCCLFGMLLEWVEVLVGVVV